MDVLGDGVADSFFEEEVTLNNIPKSILQYAMDLYANPAAEDMFDFIVEDSVVAGTVLDNGNLFDFSGLRIPVMIPALLRQRAGTDGGPIGALTTCGSLTDVFVKLA